MLQSAKKQVNNFAFLFIICFDNTFIANKRLDHNDVERVINGSKVDNNERLASSYLRCGISSTVLAACVRNVAIDLYAYIGQSALGATSIGKYNYSLKLLTQGPTLSECLVCFCDL